MSNRVNAKLYKIQDVLVESEADPTDLIDQMVDVYKNKSGNAFERITLSDRLQQDELNAQLFCYTTEPNNPSWKDFLLDIVKDEDDLDSLQNQYSSFILFVYSDQFMYAVTKGYYGHHLVAEYIDPLFGLEVLSRLVDKNDTEIKQLDQRAVFGIELGAQRFFRESYNLSYDDDFGKIYKTMLAALDEEDFKKLGVVKKRDDITQVSVEGSASLELSSRFDYKELVNRIQKIDELLETEGIQFNQFFQMPHRQLAHIREALNQALLHEAYNAYHDGEEVDFYHPLTFSYLKAESVQFRSGAQIYETTRPGSFGFIGLMEELIGADLIDPSNLEVFTETMRDCIGEFQLEENGPYLFPKNLSYWLNGEVQLEDKRFFKIDNIWYQYRDSFDGYLNDKISGFDFKKLLMEDSLLSMQNETENEFNRRHINHFIVADKVLVKQLEVADLIRIEKEDIYIYHVKKGLGRDMRVLINQILNASRLLLNQGNTALLSSYYDTFTKRYYEEGTPTIEIDGSSVTLSKEEFLAAFETKKINLVFAYSSSSERSVIDEIKSTNSRVAKLSLIYCIRDIMDSDYGFRIERIKIEN